jgi:hypothetical protein
MLLCCTEKSVKLNIFAVPFQLDGLLVLVTVNNRLIT